MRPAAHYNAAIEILDEVLTGEPAEKALLSWSRASRFAGSKDRAAIRDIVFDCLRKRASYSARFGLSGRGLALGRAHEFEELSLFDGENYSPKALSTEEISASEAQLFYSGLAQEYDFPDFLEDELQEQYGEQLPELMDAMRARAPVDLRVNLLKTTREKAADFLAQEHIFTQSLPNESGLRIELNPRKLTGSRAYGYGFVELQDLSSQLVAEFAGAKTGMEVLDYCAGGGGKSLALAMHMKGQGRLDAWDISAPRMKDIPDRAKRAGVSISVLKSAPQASYDLVFVDAPCSGSGAWRRTPDAKWRLTPEKLSALNQTQLQVLQQAKQNLRSNGTLLYATCSLLRCENQLIVEAFLKENPNFTLKSEMMLNPLNAGDGFYVAKLQPHN